MKLIAAVDANWGLGFDGKLLYHSEEDMRRFKNLTMGGTLIMGRKTLESLPNVQPLSGRTNVVLSKSRTDYPNGVVCISSKDELETIHLQEPVFVAGGGEIYRLFLSSCTEAYITKNNRIFDSDTSFPNLDDSSEWCLVEQIAGNEPGITFCRYERVMN